MNASTFRAVCLALLFCASALPLFAQQVETKKPEQFIYVLHLVPRLHLDSAWTESDKQAVGRHFARFQEGIKTGQVILAGRTREAGDKTFGIAIFTAANEAAARKYMEEDPVIMAGIMTAELHPFVLALERKNP